MKRACMMLNTTELPSSAKLNTDEQNASSIRPLKINFVRMKKLISLLVLSCIITALNAKDYKAGEIQSNQTFLYGKFEFRMYCSEGSGQLSTFFLYKPGSEQGGAANRWEEVDIEVFGKDNCTSWQSNIITEDWNGNNIHRVEAVHYGSNFKAWHTYTLEWAPGFMKWYVDGVLVRNFTDMSVLQYLTSPQRICFNIWMCNVSSWVGAMDNSKLPGYQFVQYVKHYPYVNGSFSSTADFVDDFNNLNNFIVSTHTFGENMADFATSNVGIINGTLCLANTFSYAGGIANFVPEDNNGQVNVTGITVAPTSMSINRGSTGQITATVLPSNATNKTVTWSSSNTAIATVSSTGIVTGVAVGSATITATTQDGNKTATCSVTIAQGATNLAVNKPVTSSSNESGYTASGANDGNIATRWSSLFADPQWITIDLQANYNVNQVKLNWEAASAKAYQIQVSGDNATWTTIYTATNAAGGVETLNITGTGRYVRMYGTARNTAYGYSLWEFEVYGTPATVVAVTGVSLNTTNLSLVAGNTSQLTATVAPANATNKNVTWSSSNTAVATVSSNGLVTAVAQGSATITVTTQDGNKTATCTVAVTPNTAFNLKIEAESYAYMSGIQTETTTDVGGGRNVGWIDAGDWMAYDNITIPTAGSYTITYRIASLNGGGQLQLETNAGQTVLDPAFSIPSTGGWQNWQNVVRTVTLPGGTYSIGLKAVAGGFNLNWFQISSSGTKSAKVEELSASGLSSILLYPNPFTDRVNVLKTDAGAGILNIYDLSGKMILTKQIGQGSTEINVSALKNGIYIVRYLNGNAVFTSKIVKK